MSREQQNLDLFNAPRTKGMRRAVQHADAVDLDWSDHALAFLRQYADNAGQHAFLIESVIAASRTTIAMMLRQPPTTKAWGAVVRRASKEGWLVKAGVAIGEGNACPKLLWKRA